MTTKSQGFWNANQRFLPYEKDSGASAVSPIEFIKGVKDPIITDGVDAGTLIEFVPMHIKNPPRITFMAFISSLTDSYKPAYDRVTVFGRPDPYYIWKNSPRAINLSLKLVSSGKDMALRNLLNLQWFLASLYPSYKGAAESNSVSATPLFRVRYANMILSAKDFNGVLCAISQVIVGHDAKAGYMSFNFDQFGTSDLNIYDQSIRPRYEEGADSPGKLLVPAEYTLKMSLEVVHEHSLGWEHETGNWRTKNASGFPYGLPLDKREPTAPPPNTDIADPNATDADGDSFEDSPPGSVNEGVTGATTADLLS